MVESTGLGARGPGPGPCISDVSKTQPLDLVSI